MSLEREVDQMVNDMMQKEGWTRSYALSILRSKFESEERYQEISYVDALITKIAEEQGEEQEFEPISTTTTTDTVAHNVTTTSLRKPSKVTPHQQETVSSKSVSKQLDKQTTKINKNIMQMLQPLQKHIKSADKQSELMKQLQSQLKQLQKQVSQIQRVVSMGQ
ncbi:MAG: hypothetical protein ACJ71I_06590, partial [Nitrososphaeraceae archaeon]